MSRDATLSNETVILLRRYWRGILAQPSYLSRDGRVNHWTLKELSLPTLADFARELNVSRGALTNAIIGRTYWRINDIEPPVEFKWTRGN